jgi:hypothetical protein
MNTMAIVSELADSGILAVGSTLTEIAIWAPLLNDEDAHVAAYEADLRECHCGDCRYDRRRAQTPSERRQDEFAMASWQRAVAEGTLPDGYSSLEDYGYVGAY